MSSGRQSRPSLDAIDAGSGAQALIVC